MLGIDKAEDHVGRNAKLGVWVLELLSKDGGCEVVPEESAVLNVELDGIAEEL